jgi:hypothetical protein
MKIKNSSRLRYISILGYIGILGFVLACMAVTGGSSSVEQGSLQLDNGIVKVQNQNGDWESLAGTSSFELVAPLESRDPWTVAGRALATNELTKIEEELQVGDLVRVRGTILEDGSWLAYSIESAQNQTNQTITIIGTVTSIDPWVVNGIILNVTDSTVINGKVTPGMLARVEILLLEDGTWEVISISPLGDFPPTTGCAAIVATVVSVNGSEIQFLGWPTTVIIGDTEAKDDHNNDEGEDNNNGDVAVTIEPGQKVLAVVCVSNNGQLVIVQIIVLNIDTDGNDNASGEGGKVLVCHKPGKKGGHTLSISSSAVPAHLGHGDKLGPCP